jgi:excisionase family DNA binding protein
MHAAAASRRLVLTRAEVADAASVSVATVDRAIAIGELPALRIGPGRRLVRIHRDAFTAWLNHSEETHDAA